MCVYVCTRMQLKIEVKNVGKPPHVRKRPMLYRKKST